MKRSVRYKLRKILLLFVASCLSTLVIAQENKMLSVHFKNETLAKVIKELEKLSGYEFLYSQESLSKIPRITMHATEKSLDAILELCFSNTNFTYKIEEKTVIIRLKNMSKKRTETISGIVLNQEGLPLPGTTILVNDTKVSMTTDKDGKFTLEIPEIPKLVLTFRFIGYEKQEIKITDQKELKIVLEEKKEVIPDVIVTGYTRINRSSFTGSSTRVDKKAIKSISPTNIIDILQIFEPSLRIVPNNEMGSDPNTLPEFYIRGRSGIGVKELDKEVVSKSSLSNNPNTPVFILDGYEVNTEKIYDLDLNRIESITILKDAAATAIYGSRAANGVIVIESVVPQPGKLKVSYNLNGAITAPDLSDYNLMNAKEKLETEVAAGLFEATLTSDQIDKKIEYQRKLNNIIKGVDTDWSSLPLTTQFNQKHSLYVEGGTSEIRYGVALHYNGQNGVMKGSHRTTYGGELYLDYRFKNLQIRNQVSYEKMKSQNSPYGDFSDYTRKNPYDEYERNGQYVEYTESWNDDYGTLNILNPMYEAKLDNFSQSGYRLLTNNLNMNWYITDHLLVKGQLSFSQYDTDSENFTDPLSSVYLYYPVDDQARGDLRITDAHRNNLDGNFLVSYNNVIAKHNINFSAGINILEIKSNNGSEHYRGFPSGKLHSINNALKTVEKKTVSENHTRLFGSFLCLNYTYDNLYLLDLSARFDGSSEFGKDDKTAPFWSGGIGVNLHHYPFIKRANLFNELKIRATFGQTGKINNAPYAAKHIYKTIDDTWYPTGNGVYMQSMGNDQLGWETTYILNIGTDVALWKNLLQISGSWYNKKTVDLVTEVTIPAASGFISYMANIGEVRNRGFELNIKANIIHTQRLHLSVYGNLAHNNNKILKISNALKSYNDRVDEYFNEYDKNASNAANNKYSKPFMKYAEGGSLTSIWGIKSLGINPADGNEILVNRNGTITYEWNTSEQVIIGNTEPDAQGAFGLNMNYKGFTLSASFLYEFGGQAYNQTLVNNVENAQLSTSNADRRVLNDRWKKWGDVSKFKSIKNASKQVTRPTSRFCQNNNLLQFNSLTVGYDFDTSLLEHIHISKMSLQFNMKDIAYISSIKRERGLAYPFARTFNFTLNVSF